VCFSFLYFSFILPSVLLFVCVVFRECTMSSKQENDSYSVNFRKNRGAFVAGSIRGGKSRLKAVSLVATSKSSE